jgi:uncharacterized membrane protein YbaN (DUF454 family)
MSLMTCFQELRHNIVETFAIDAPLPGIPAATTGTIATPSHRRESTKSRTEPVRDAGGPWIGCCERQGVVEIHDPRLLGPGHAAFCRALVDAAVARFGAVRAEVRTETSTCRLEFGPGRFDRMELAGRAASAVRAATSAVRDGAGEREDIATGRSILTASAAGSVASPPATRSPFQKREGQPPAEPALTGAAARREPRPAGKPLSGTGSRGTSRRARTSAKRSAAARKGSRRASDLIKAGASFALAVGGIILPGIPTLPFLILSGRYAIRVSPRIERLLMGQPWCAALLTKAENASDPALDWRSLGKTIGVAVLFTAACAILNPPLPLVLGLELATTVFLGCRELGRPAGRKTVLIAA